MATETEILRRIWKQASSRGFTLFRNNIGLAVYKDGSRVQYGLCPGSADLIGWRPITITPDMLNSTIAQFVAIEVKTPTGRLTKRQRNWLRTLEQAGGLALVVRSTDDIPDTTK